MNEDIKDDLARRLARLDIAWHAMRGQDGAAPEVIETRARWWEMALAGDLGQAKPADEAAYQVLRYLVPEAEAAESGFWRSDLGRTIARYGYAPVNGDGQVPAAVVGAIMGFTRSRAHELQQRGRLCTPALVAWALIEREASRG